MDQFAAQCCVSVSVIMKIYLEHVSRRPHGLVTETKERLLFIVLQVTCYRVFGFPDDGVIKAVGLFGAEKGKPVLRWETLNGICF